MFSNRSSYIATILAVSVFGTISAATSSSPTLHVKGEHYITGPQALQKVNSEDAFKDYRKMLVGKTGFIPVPLDYRNPERKMNLFYRIPRALDPSKPSLIFFYGGPGGTSTGLTIEDRLIDFNVVYFDQRGTGFSRPPTLEDLENPRYFESEFIARDAKVLLDFLGIKKVSLYGQSYGTVVATIFAHFFPEMTTAVVLEGTVFNGTTDLWINPDRVRILNGFLLSLSPEVRARIIQLSQNGVLPPTWFSRLAADYLRGDNFAATLKSRLDASFAGNDLSFEDEIRSEVDQSSQAEDSAYWGAYMYHQIACQELSLGKPYGSGDLIFDINGKLVPDPSDSSKEICLQLPGMAGRMNRTYFSTSYAFSPMVTYFQGREDGNTGVTNAIRHFQAVPTGHASLVLVAHAGHGPIMGCMNIGKFDPNPPLCVRQSEEVALLTKALLGKTLSPADVEKIGPDWEVKAQK